MQANEVAFAPLWSRRLLLVYGVDEAETWAFLAAFVSVLLTHSDADLYGSDCNCREVGNKKDPARDGSDFLAYVMGANTDMPKRR